MERGKGMARDKWHEESGIGKRERDRQREKMRGEGREE